MADTKMQPSSQNAAGGIENVMEEALQMQNPANQLKVSIENLDEFV